MGKAVIGIDVAKDSLEVVLLEDEVSRHASFKNNSTGFEKLEQWLRKYTSSPVHACLEATGQYGEGVAEYLYEKGYAVSVVNPVRIKAYGESKISRNKTDKLDAFLIADFCARQSPALWKPIPLQVRQLQGLMRRLEDLKAMRKQEVNRLKSGKLTPQVEADLKKHLEYLDQAISQMEKDIQDHSNQDADLKAQKDLMVSINGIGDKTACLLLAEIPHLRDFEHVNELVAFSGLNPQARRSGTSINGKPRLSKKGSSRIRHGLYFPAIVAQKHNPILKAFAERLLNAGKSKLCVIGAVMRKLLHLVFGVLKSGRPFDPNYRNNIPVTS